MRDLVRRITQVSNRSTPSIWNAPRYVMLDYRACSRPGKLRKWPSSTCIAGSRSEAGLFGGRHHRWRSGHLGVGHHELLAAVCDGRVDAVLAMETSRLAL